MICKNCGKKISATPKGFAIINGTAIIICEECAIQYPEQELTQNDIEELYWGD